MVLVTAVAPGSTAQRLGLRIGDAVAALNETIVKSTADFGAALSDAALLPGDEVRLSVVRGGGSAQSPTRTHTLAGPVGVDGNRPTVAEIADLRLRVRPALLVKMKLAALVKADAKRQERELRVLERALGDTSIEDVSPQQEHGSDMDGWITKGPAQGQGAKAQAQAAAQAEYVGDINIKELDIAPMLRPRVGGSAGRLVRLKSNHFTLRFKPGVVYHYTCEISPSCAKVCVFFILNGSVFQL